MKTELPLGGQCLDGPDVEPAWRRDAPLRHAQHVVDRRERSRSEPLARRELGRLDRGGKFGEDRLSLVVQPIQQIGEEDRHELRERARVARLHVLDSRVVGPQRIGRLHERRAEMRPEHVPDLLCSRLSDRLVGLHSREREHRFTNHTDADALERSGRAR